MKLSLRQMMMMKADRLKALEFFRLVWDYVVSAGMRPSGYNYDLENDAFVVFLADGAFYIRCRDGMMHAYRGASAICHGLNEDYRKIVNFTHHCIRSADNGF
jgi:hypothetical protein